MIRFIKITILFIATTLSLQANNTPEKQDLIDVTGRVIDEISGIGLEFATVAFLDLNNKVINGTITDRGGNYKMSIEPGIYNIRFEYIGFKTQTLKNQNLQQNTLLKTIKLSESAETLDEIVVRAETTEVEIRLDKKVYNIGKDLTVGGATVGDALDNVPSVTVDADGAISLRGNQNVRILINGRPSAIAGFGSTDALQSLPADAIERVEVITSPSARYDAEGTAGILNIILRKDKVLGFNGSIQVNYREPTGYGGTGNVNYRTKKFNIFNTTSFNVRNSPGQGVFRNQFFSSSVVNPLVIETRDIDRNDVSLNTNLGMEYYLNKKSSITTSFFYSEGEDEDKTINITDEFNPDNELAVTRTRIEDETEDDSNYQISLNYINRFNDDGHVLTADLQYGIDNEGETSLIAERNTFPAIEELPSEFITTDEEGNEFLAQVDYVFPINENQQFEAGYRGNFEETTTDFVVNEQLIPGGEFIKNDSLSNIFTYTENVNALYTQYGNKFGKFSFLAGLRFEHTRLAGEVSAADVDNADNLVINFDNDYPGLFPTLNLNYEISDNENITFGYNRRINRPRGRFVNPFPSRSSEANIFQGNPNLNPAFANAFDIGYLKKWGKTLTLTSSVYYQLETDAFERIQEDTGLQTPNGIPIIRTIPINLSTNERIGFELGLLYNPTKWLRVNGSFNFFQFTTEGDFNGIDYGAQNTSYFSRLSTKVSLPYKIEWQTNAIYRGPTNNAQTRNEDILFLNVAFSKDIFNDKATIAINIRDVFNSRKRLTYTETDTFISDSELQFRVRTFNLSFIYRFNQKKEKTRNNDRDNGDDDF
ncbi:TonB-dependent receptor [Winogradskyella sp. DF17]|uniref:TonB-dependent receptor n=1 Tax=Winogradskyella pelagia TaxID=2819984 RepID=A0ABS3SZY6_9FLAO|nr:outer membrane beta-barrel family protein [Winogradskyella sp. DF17]MBO3116055.1 TonB-dependent receptor [Winogradskyella sp. DF17]